MTFINSWRKVGHREGRREILEVALSELLKEQFGQIPDWAAKRLAAADSATLLVWVRSLVKNNRLENLFDPQP